MKLSKRTEYMLLGLLVILNIIRRLPVTPHIFNTTDTPGAYVHANSISTNGYADWFLSPLSFFGLYPLSYPTGEHFFLSGLSQSTSVEMEWTIWIAATFFGVLGVLTSYVMAKEINNDFLFAFSVAFVYSLSPLFIDWTNWSATTRGLFVTILPLFIWCLLRYHNQKEGGLKYLLLSVGLLIILGAIHRMAFFMPLILTSFGMCIFLYVINKKINISKIITPKISISLFFALFLPLLLLPFTPLGFYHSLESYIGGHESGYFFHGSAPYHILLNMGAEYAMAVGILIILIPIGLFSLLLKKQKTFSDAFLLACILCFASTFADPRYITGFVLFILSLLIGFGLLGIPKMFNKVKKVKSMAPLILVVILLLSALLPYFVVVRPVPSLPMHTEYINELTYNAAFFIKAYGVGLPRISPLPFIREINAIAGPPYQHSYSNEINRISSWTIEPISISNFITDFLKYKSLYSVKKPWYEHFEYLDCDNMYVNLVLENKTYLVIEDDSLPSHLPFYVSTRATKPKIYDNGLESIWYLNY